MDVASFKLAPRLQINKEASAYFPLHQEITVPNFKVLFALKVYDSTLSKHTVTCAHFWVQFSSVQLFSLVLLFVTPWTIACKASLSITNSQSLLKLMSIELVMPSSHFILCGPLLLVLSIFPSIRVFSNESILCIRWPKYWSFKISISPSNEYSGLISFRMDWLDILAVQGTLKSPLQHHSSKYQLFNTQLSS